MECVRFRILRASDFKPQGAARRFGQLDLSNRTHYSRNFKGCPGSGTHQVVIDRLVLDERRPGLIVGPCMKCGA